MNRRSFFQLLGISPAALMFKPEKKINGLSVEEIRSIVKKFRGEEINTVPLHPYCQNELIKITAYEVK